MIWAKTLFVGFVFASILALSQSTVSAGWVNGYYKSNGTYVNGYWKSNPNGLKYDNYSFDGDWSDAFNKSYYSPTKNYSSDWYKPTWVTQSDYSVGKSFYDSRNSYSKYSSNLFDYDYDFTKDPIYKYTPTYNYGYNYLNSVNSYRSSYFDYDTINSYKPYSTYSTPSYNYTSPTYNYSAPTYNSYSSPTYDYSTPSYSSPSYTSPSYNYSSPSYSSTCYYSC